MRGRKIGRGDLQGARRRLNRRPFDFLFGARGALVLEKTLDFDRVDVVRNSERSIPLESRDARGGRDDSGEGVPANTDAAICLLDEELIGRFWITRSGDELRVSSLDNASEGFGVETLFGLGWIFVAIDVDADRGASGVVEGELLVLPSFVAMGGDGLIE